MTTSVTSIAAFVLVVLAGGGLAVVNQDEINEGISSALVSAEVDPNSEIIPIRSGEGPTVTDEELAAAIAQMEQDRTGLDPSKSVDLTNAASDADGGAGKVNNILALQREGANFGYNNLKPGEKEEFAYSFDFTDAADSPDGGAAMVMEIGRLQQSGVDFLAR